MARRPATVWAVQLFTLTRIICALVFATLAFQRVPRTFLVVLYGAAMFSDLADGYLAERLSARTYFGKVLDLVSDKTLTVVSLLYAAERGISLLPLAFIAAREIVMIGMRLVSVEGRQLLPTNRFFGGMLALVVWGNTALLIWTVGYTRPYAVVEVLYWICAVMFAVNLAKRVRATAPQIMASLESDE